MKELGEMMVFISVIIAAVLVFCFVLFFVKNKRLLLFVIVYILWTVLGISLLMR